MVLLLGMPVKWAFLPPRNKMPVLPFLGISVFGKRDAVFGKSPVARRKSSENRGINNHMWYCFACLYACDS